MRIHIYQARYRDITATVKYPPRVFTYRTRSDGRAPSLPSPFLSLDFASSCIALVGPSLDSGVCVSVLFRFNLSLRLLRNPHAPLRIRNGEWIKRTNRFNIRRWSTFRNFVSTYVVDNERSKAAISCLQLAGDIVDFRLVKIRKIIVLSWQVRF